MATLTDHLDRLREKPEHVRHRIAFLTSAGVTALVAILWVTALATSGTLALKQTAPEVVDGQPRVAETFAETKSAFSELMGAVGAAAGATSSEPTLTTVESRTVTTFDTKIGNDTDKTVIPF